MVNLGNAPSGCPGYGTAICPLNSDTSRAASAGTSNLVARADHVHQMPSCIANGPGFVCISASCSRLEAACTGITLRGGVAGTADSAITFYMRGRCGYSGPPVSFDMKPTSDGDMIKVTVQNRQGYYAKQAYLPRVPTLTWAQLQSQLGIYANCSFSGGYIAGKGVLLGGYFASNGYVYYRAFWPGTGCTCNYSRDGSSLADIQGVITWAS